MQGGPSLCDRLGPRTQPGPRSSTTSPNPSDGLFVVMTALRQIADHSRLPDGGHGRGVSSLPLPAGEPLHFLSLTTAKTRSSPRRTAPNKAEIAYDPLRKSETNPHRRRGFVQVVVSGMRRRSASVPFSKQTAPVHS